MLVKQSDFIVAANPHVAEIWQSRGYKVTMIPFGADIDAYRDIDRLAPADIGLPAPIAGFVGQINERLDMRLLEAVADRGRSILLVGPHDPAREPEGWSAFIKRPNVRWVGQKQYTELPGYLRAIDVGLVPYTDSPFNRGSFPLKTLEYLAAGRAVVATSLPATLWLQTSLIKVADDPAAFADAVDRSLMEPRTPQIFDARQAFAQQHSWAQRSRAFIDLMTSKTHVET
jgi:teichuronic acid biosynthesis glycosyltransferase TuaH